MKSNLKILGFLFAGSLAYFSFFETKFFESESVIKIKNDSKNLEFALIPALATANEEAYEIREFIFSDEGTSLIVELLKNEEKFQDFYPNLLDLNKKYFYSEREYLKKFITVDIDESSNVLKIKSQSYNSDSALYLNNLLIVMMQYYFDNKLALSSLITSTNSICNFVDLNNNSNKLGFDFSDKTKELIESVENGNIIYESNIQRRQDCISKIETNNINSKKFESVPFEVQKSLSITQSEKLLSDYVLSDQVTNFTSDKLILVGVPQMNSEPKNNSSIIKSLILSLAFSLTIFAFNMLFIIFREN
tara:strand:+ start:269 stop:1183 length:915 start_codon:yes stop_codon:yes gene_type:complete